ncbi:MAG: hypothetical protein AAB729_05595 [Patescibacteria group bacterium]
MAYQRITHLLKANLPKERDFSLSQEQVGKLRTASHVALALFAEVGVATISLVAPNLLQALKPLLKKKTRHGVGANRGQKDVARTFYYLKRHGYIKFRPVAGDVEVSLTNAGKERLQHINFQYLSVGKRTKWDCKWWQTAADIPTLSHRTGADLLRKKLKRMGFFPLQRSLWFFPFDPRAEIEFICRHYGIEQFVTVMEINRLDEEDENQLKNYFMSRHIL